MHIQVGLSNLTFSFLLMEAHPITTPLPPNYFALVKHNYFASEVPFSCVVDLWPLKFVKWKDCINSAADGESLSGDWLGVLRGFGLRAGFF